MTFAVEFGERRAGVPGSGGPGIILESVGKAYSSNILVIYEDGIT